MSHTKFLLFVFLSVTQLYTDETLGSSQSKVRGISSNQLNDFTRSTSTPTHPARTSGPFWANASLEGVMVRCSDAQRRCLEVRRLLDPASGKCYPVGDERPCSNGLWALDSNALAVGNLLGRCYRSRPCENLGYRMAFDGQCYNESYVEHTLCADWGDVVFHPLGGMECALALESAGNEASAQRTTSPSEGTIRRCALPRLRWQLPRGRVRNDSGELLCAERGQLPAPGGGCVTPLRRGFCDAGQRVVMDVEALRGGRLRARCAPRRPCAAGEVLLMGKCRSKEDISNMLCPGESFLELPSGEVQCAGKNGGTVKMFTSGINENEFNIFVKLMPVTRESIFIAGTECSFDDEGNCARPVEEITQGMIQIWTED